MAAAARALGSTPRIIGYKVETYGIDPKKYVYVIVVNHACRIHLRSIRGRSRKFLRAGLTL